jgi:hypothetical protein
MKIQIKSRQFCKRSKDSVFAPLSTKKDSWAAGVASGQAHWRSCVQFQAPKDKEN